MGNWNLKCEMKVWIILFQSVAIFYSELLLCSYKKCISEVDICFTIFLYSSTFITFKCYTIIPTLFDTVPVERFILGLKISFSCRDLFLIRVKSFSQEYFFETSKEPVVAVVGNCKWGNCKMYSHSSLIQT